MMGSGRLLAALGLCAAGIAGYATDARAQTAPTAEGGVGIPATAVAPLLRRPDRTSVV